MFLILGRVADQRGRQHDHAWLLAPYEGGWRVVDSVESQANLRYAPLVVLGAAGAWSAIRPDEIDALQPAFFLSIHCQINDEALGKLLPPTDLDDINRTTGRVDDSFVHPNYDPREHFDNALIDESIELLEDRLGWNGETRLHTVASDARSVIAYGLACHAIADFYSHSNYVPMALACYGGGPGEIPTLDEAVGDAAFESFVNARWANSSMWRDREGYSSVEPFPLPTELQKCLITGGYGGDGWRPRADIPHHDIFAVDQPASALVDAPAIQRRQHPFAYPGEWTAQFDLRRSLAIRHVRHALERVQAGDAAPFLGRGRSLPALLRPPIWVSAGKGVAEARALPDRAAGGWLVG